MQRAFSIVAIAAWAGYHGVSGLGALAAGMEAVPVLPFGLALSSPDLSFPASFALALAHLALGCGFAVAVRQVAQARVGAERAELTALVCLSASLALAAILWLVGAGGAQAGAFAAGVAVTALALFFDRLVELDDEEGEAEYRNFLRAGASLGVAMHAGRPEHDRPRSPRRAGQV